MAKVNYKFQKRQKELDRLKKQEEKRLRKVDGKDEPDADIPDEASTAEEGE